MRHLTRYLVVTAALCCGTVPAVQAADPAPPPPAARIATTAAAGAAPLRAAMNSGARGPAAPSNLDPVRGPVATNPHAYPSDTIGMQPYHTWQGYSPN